MKIALCLSGLVKENYRENLMTLREHLIKPFEVDTFIHTWSKMGTDNIAHWYNQNYSLQEHIAKTNKQPEVKIRDILHDYRPREIEVEYPDIYQFYTKYYIEQIPSFFNNVMMQYSIYKSNELKKNFENKYGFKYDIVIRCRFDLYFKQLEMCHTYNEAGEGVIFLPPSFNYDIVVIDDMKKKSEDIGISYMPNDQFAYSNSAAMDFYSSIYLLREKNIKQYIAHSEGSITEHLWTKNRSGFRNIKINDRIKMRINRCLT